MIFWLAILAALGCAICNGIAAILEKVSADKKSRQTSIRIGFIVQLLRDWPYVVGLVLDGLAWILTLVAVQTLPLFVVQPIIAFSVVVTALIDRFILHHHLGIRVRVALLFIFSGLALLALTATPEKAASVQHTARWCVIFAPIVLAILASPFVKIQKHYSTVVIAAISGVAFGGTAVVGRMLTFSHPYWRIIENPLLWSLLAYGFVGILLFTIALQRQRASVVNAAMIAFETLAPIITGIALLGDRPRHGLWAVVFIGVLLAFIGTGIITTGPETAPNTKRIAKK
jgi:drug/metabolite transporter (DMT)-like permease